MYTKRIRAKDEHAKEKNDGSPNHRDQPLSLVASLEGRRGWCLPVATEVSTTYKQTEFNKYTLYNSGSRRGKFRLNNAGRLGSTCNMRRLRQEEKNEGCNRLQFLKVFSEMISASPKMYQQINVVDPLKTSRILGLSEAMRYYFLP